MDAFTTSLQRELICLEKNEPHVVSPSLQPLKNAAGKRVAEYGLPTAKNEAWKYTSLASLSKTGFSLAQKTDQAALDINTFECISRAPEFENRAVFVNGGFRADLSRLHLLPAGLKVCNTGCELGANEDVLVQTLGKETTRHDIFTDLNTAFLKEVLLIEVAENATIDCPLHIIFVGSSNDPSLLRLPRVIVKGRPNSSLKIIEEYVSTQRDLGFTNGVTDVVLEGGSQIHHSRLQTESDEASHIGRLSVEVGKNSNFSSDSVVFGAELSRVDIDIVLADQGATCRLNGLFVGDGQQHIDHHTLVDHAVGNTHSEELYHGALDGYSHGVFNGKVIVRKDAQRISAKQTSKNLLLSGQSEIDTKPELEIYADDVTCAHGATVGELDQQALFYLRSRGIHEEDARALLTLAFAEKAIENIPYPAIRDWIESRFIEDYRYSKLNGTPGLP